MCVCVHATKYGAFPEQRARFDTGRTCKLHTEEHLAPRGIQTPVGQTARTTALPWLAQYLKINKSGLSKIDHIYWSNKLVFEGSVELYYSIIYLTFAKNVMSYSSGSAFRQCFIVYTAFKYHLYLHTHTYILYI